jgi:hypothetical protein
MPKAELAEFLEHHGDDAHLVEVFRDKAATGAQVAETGLFSCLMSVTSNRSKSMAAS